MTTTLASRTGTSPAGQKRGIAPWKWPAWAVLAVAVIIAADWQFSRQDDPMGDRPWQLPAPVVGLPTYADALSAMDAQVERKQALVDVFPDDWVRLEGAALALLDRFRLTGDYDDLAQARIMAERGLQLAEPPSGPVLASGEISLASHRLAQAEAALALFDRWAAPDNSELASAAAMAGDIAFYRGDMEKARRTYAEAQAHDPAGMALRTAIIDKAQGNFDAAVLGMRTSLEKRRRPSPYSVATTALQIGAVELARGNMAEARRRFLEADRLFPGHWLTEAHLAQAAAIDGEPQRGIDLMRRVAQRSGNAEAMDALAMLLRTFGKPEESRMWARRAGQEWKRRIAIAPEAAYGHAVEHELVFGSPARALALAQRNLAHRPYGESRLLLANALVQTGRYGDALDQLRRAEASGWRSAPLYALRAQILDIEGDKEGAAKSRDAARALNPRIFEPETALVWFSHG